jgi:S1-C subfamily serine protease
MRLALSLALLLTCIAQGREWRSVQPGRAVNGDFVKLTNDQLWIRTPQGQPLNIKLDLIAPDDQAYARAAQTALEQGQKLGPTSFEVAQNTPFGSLCRMAMKLGNGSILFTGEQFLLLPESSTQLKSGTRLTDKALFFAGPRTFHPLQGPAFPLRAFALSLDAAATALADLAAQRKSADIYEPKVIISEVLALGFGISATAAGEAHIVVDAAALEGMKSIDIDLGKKRSPGTLVAMDSKLGIALIACQGSLEPARLAARKPLALGQVVLAISYSLKPTRRDFGETSVTRGIVSKLNEGSLQFETDALAAPGSIGGLVISEKGDVVGLMLQQPLSKTTAPPPPAPRLTRCISTEAIARWLDAIPKAPALRPMLSFVNLQDTADTLKRSALIVRITRETIQETKPPIAGPSGTATSAATGWSLSKSGTRHNSKCRYFNAANACQATDGTACKTCGG